MKRGNWLLWALAISAFAATAIMMIELFVGPTAVFFIAAGLVLISGLTVAFTKEK